MKPIRVFYHCRLSGGDPPIDFDHASAIMQEQIMYLKAYGLADQSELVTVGVNGGEMDYCAASTIALTVINKATMIKYPDHYRGELPTLCLLRDFCKDHPDHYVFYHHIKGALYKGQEMWKRWRTCMERSLVQGWKYCTEMMDAGYDSVGCHWMTPERYGSHLVSNPYWGGNFWWAKSDFINTLPPLRPTAETREQFYEAELWIGTGPRRPKVMDLHPVWPGLTCPS